MSKRVFLYVRGGDYSAMTFRGNYNVQEFYEDMVKEGVTDKTINTDSFCADITIKEFGEVDSEFIGFVFDNLCDYDHLKDADIFEVKPVE